MKKNIRITIIGAGAMGSSVGKAILVSKNPWKLTAIDPNTNKLKSLKSKFSKLVISSGYDSLSNADVVILAVKPQSFSELAGLIKSVISKKALVISIMTGCTAKNIHKALGTPRVIHAMPTLGAQFGESMTVWTAQGLTADDKKFANVFFALLGKHLYVKNEDFVNKNTSVSASGVGFFAYIVEEYVAQTMKLGFSQKEAMMLVLQTLQSTNTILQKGEWTPAELRMKVTSHKGTTDAGLKVLAKGELSRILQKTLEAAYRRAEELSK